MEIRALTRNDFELVRELYFATKRRFRPEEYDRWRLYDSPWGDSPAAIAVDGDVCAGLYIIWPALLELGGTPTLGAQSMDTMTHPDYRGKGLFIKLADACFEIAAAQGIELVYGFPNDQSYPGFIRRLNFDHVGDIPAWSYSARGKGLFGRRPSSPKSSGYTLATTSPDAEAFGDLVRTALPEGAPCTVAKSAEWLTWRYGPASGEEYTWLTAYTDSELRAAILLGERDARWGTDFRGDVRVHEAAGDTDALRALLAQAATDVVERDGKRLSMLARDPSIESALDATGFTPFGTQQLIVRKLTASKLDGNVHHFPYWRVVGGDMDSF
jgi:GNAT superfamily N-acetyltransferase